MFLLICLLDVFLMQKKNKKKLSLEDLLELFQSFSNHAFPATENKGLVLCLLACLLLYIR